jgi:glycosyltransferase involved in cell wall biosynthesis
MEIEDLTIVVCCNKKDFFLARICIASIRYYYPSIIIELIKDPGNGKFNSVELEKLMKVKNVDLKIKKLGWSGAKFHYLYQAAKGKKVLMLDADIVFIGPFLERLLPAIAKNDYVVSIERLSSPDREWSRITYFDIDAVEATYPQYKYPGFFFNAGQIFLTVGTINKSDLSEFFDPYQYPFWQKPYLFPMVDQSVYNYVLPVLESQDKIKVGKENFMIWAKSENAAGVSLKQLSERSLLAGVIHWAGCDRTRNVSKMVNGHILLYFENYYYECLKGGRMLYLFRKIIPWFDFNLRQFYHGLKTLREIN